MIFFNPVLYPDQTSVALWRGGGSCPLSTHSSSTFGQQKIILNDFWVFFSEWANYQVPNKDVSSNYYSLVLSTPIQGRIQGGSPFVVICSHRPTHQAGPATPLSTQWRTDRGVGARGRGGTVLQASLP